MRHSLTTPLYRALCEVTQKDFSRFHMPGHKGIDRTGVFGDALRFDITEIDGTDSLYHASDCILQCEQRIAAYYGARRSIISTQGSTLCIQTMLALVRERGRTLIIARGAHVSAANAVALLDFDPVWVYPELNQITGVGMPVTPQQIEDALLGAKDAAAVYITSPSYYGVLTDVEGIAAVCGRYGVPLVVDAAHGAHLKAAGLPDPIQQGAAMCAQSAHKTLPVLTGGAFLHIAHEQFASGAKDAMALFGSTSPSYLIMLSLDTCVAYLETDAHAEFAALRSCVGGIEQLAHSHGFTQAIPNGVLHDGTRLSLCAQELGYSGEELARHLAAYRIEPEYVGESAVVLLPSPANTARDFKRLREAIAAIVPLALHPQPVLPFVKAVQAMRPRQAMFAKKETVCLAGACGRIAAQNQSTCPPGVPVVLCGERITEGAVQQMHRYGIKHVTVVAAQHS